MFKVLGRTILYVVSGAALLLITIGGQTQKVIAADHVDIKQALPTKEELPEFSNYQVFSGAKGKSAEAKRRADEARLRVSVLIASSEAEAQQWTHMTVTNSANAGMLKSAPSGRKIGQEVWQSKYSKGQPFGSFTLVARDGLSIVIVELMLKIDKGSRGQAMQRPIQTADLNLVENHALKCLDKLTAMGYTSRSATSRAKPPKPHR